MTTIPNMPQDYVYSNDGELYYPCRFCERAFKYKKSFNTHVDKCHSMEISHEKSQQTPVYIDIMSEPHSRAHSSYYTMENASADPRKTQETTRNEKKKNLKSVIENIVDKKLKQAGLLRPEEEPGGLNNVMENLNLDEFFYGTDYEEYPEVIDIDENFVENNPDMELQDARSFEQVRINPQLLQNHKGIMNVSLKDLQNISLISKKSGLPQEISRKIPSETTVIYLDTKNSAGSLKKLQENNPSLQITSIGSDFYQEHGFSVEKNIGKAPKNIQYYTEKSTKNQPNLEIREFPIQKNLNPNYVHLQKTSKPTQNEIAFKKGLNTSLNNQKANLHIKKGLNTPQNLQKQINLAQKNFNLASKSGLLVQKIASSSQKSSNRNETVQSLLKKSQKIELIEVSPDLPTSRVLRSDLTRTPPKNKSKSNVSTSKLNVGNEGKASITYIDDEINEDIEEIEVLSDSDNSEVQEISNSNVNSAVSHAQSIAERIQKFNQTQRAINNLKSNQTNSIFNRHNLINPRISIGSNGQPTITYDITASQTEKNENILIGNKESELEKLQNIVKQLPGTSTLKNLGISAKNYEKSQEIFENTIRSFDTAHKIHETIQESYEKTLRTPKKQQNVERAPKNNEKTIRINDKLIKISDKTQKIGEKFKNSETAVKTNEKSLKSNERIHKINEKLAKTNEKLPKNIERTIKTNEKTIKTSERLLKTNEKLSKSYEKPLNIHEKNSKLNENTQELYENNSEVDENQEIPVETDEPSTNKAFEVIINDKNVIKLYGQPKLTIGPTGVPIITLSDENKVDIDGISSNSDVEIDAMTSPDVSEIFDEFILIEDDEEKALEGPEEETEEVNSPDVKKNAQKPKLNQRTNYMGKLRNRKTNSKRPEIEHEVATIGPNLLKLTIRQKTNVQKDNEQTVYIKRKNKKSKERIKKQSFRVVPRSRNPLMMKFKKISKKQAEEGNFHASSSEEEIEKTTKILTLPPNLDVYNFEDETETITLKTKGKKHQNKVDTLKICLKQNVMDGFFVKKSVDKNKDIVVLDDSKKIVGKIGNLLIEDEVEDASPCEFKEIVENSVGGNEIFDQTTTLQISKTKLDKKVQKTVEVSDKKSVLRPKDKKINIQDNNTNESNTVSQPNTIKNKEKKVNENLQNSVVDNKKVLRNSKSAQIPNKNAQISNKDAQTLNKDAQIPTKGKTVNAQIKDRGLHAQNLSNAQISGRDTKSTAKSKNSAQKDAQTTEKEESSSNYHDSIMMDKQKFLEICELVYNNNAKRQENLLDDNRKNTLDMDKNLLNTGKSEQVTSKEIIDDKKSEIAARKVKESTLKPDIINLEAISKKSVEKKVTSTPLNENETKVVENKNLTPIRTLRSKTKSNSNIEIPNKNADINLKKTDVKEDKAVENLEKVQNLQNVPSAPKTQIAPKAQIAPKNQIAPKTQISQKVIEDIKTTQKLLNVQEPKISQRTQKLLQNAQMVLQTQNLQKPQKQPTQNLQNSQKQTTQNLQNSLKQTTQNPQKQPEINTQQSNNVKNEKSEVTTIETTPKKTKTLENKKLNMEEVIIIESSDKNVTKQDEKLEIKTNNEVITNKKIVETSPMKQTKKLSNSSIDLDKITITNQPRSLSSSFPSTRMTRSSTKGFKKSINDAIQAIDVPVSDNEESFTIVVAADVHYCPNESKKLPDGSIERKTMGKNQKKILPQDLDAITIETIEIDKTKATRKPRNKLAKTVSKATEINIERSSKRLQALKSLPNSKTTHKKVPESEKNDAKPEAPLKPKRKVQNKKLTKPKNTKLISDYFKPASSIVEVKKEETDALQNGEMESDSDISVNLTESQKHGAITLNENSKIEIENDIVISQFDEETPKIEEDIQKASKSKSDTKVDPPKNKNDAAKAPKRKNETQKGKNELPKPKNVIEKQKNDIEKHKNDIERQQNDIEKNKSGVQNSKKDAQNTKNAVPNAKNQIVNNKNDILNNKNDCNNKNEDSSNKNEVFNNTNELSGENDLQNSEIDIQNDLQETKNDIGNSPKGKSAPQKIKKAKNVSQKAKNNSRKAKNVFQKVKINFRKPKVVSQKTKNASKTGKNVKSGPQNDSQTPKKQNDTLPNQTNPQTSGDAQISTKIVANTSKRKAKRKNVKNDSTNVKNAQTSIEATNVLSENQSQNKAVPENSKKRSRNPKTEEISPQNAKKAKIETPDNNENWSEVSNSGDEYKPPENEPATAPNRKRSRPKGLAKNLNSKNTTKFEKVKSPRKRVKKEVKDEIINVKIPVINHPVDSVVIDNEHVCLKCGKVSKDFIEFETHKKSHHHKIRMPEEELAKYDEIFKKAIIKLCPICKVPIPRKDSWRRHRRFHSNALTYNCKICNKGFTRKELRNAHEKRHAMNNKPTTP